MTGSQEVIGSIPLGSTTLKSLSMIMLRLFYLCKHMPYSVYILESESTGKLYIGQTNDLDRRLRQHQRGYVRSTKRRGPWKLLKRVELESRADAVMLELKLKKMKNPARVRAYLGLS